MIPDDLPLPAIIAAGGQVLQLVTQLIAQALTARQEAAAAILAGLLAARDALQTEHDRTHEAIDARDLSTRGQLDAMLSSAKKDGLK